MSAYNVTFRNNCRLCGSKSLRKFLHFDRIPFFDEVIPAERRGQEFVAPMDVYFCDDCKSVQTLHDVDISSYYVDYQYVASDSLFIRQYMQLLAREVCTRFNLKPGDVVLEIGSADGFQLQCFQQLGARVLGFEPAENLCLLSRQHGITVINDLFSAKTVHKIPGDFKPAQAVILLHTFDHLLNPLEFLADISKVLDPHRGVLILEVHDLDAIVKKRETALFGHEHVTFLHLGSMERLLDRCGFELLDAGFIPNELQRGSSMIIAAGLKGCDLKRNQTLDLNKFSYLDQWETLQGLEKDVKASYQNLIRYVQEAVAGGKRLAGYGGWGRGVTTLAMAGFSPSDLVYVCDRNPALHGLFTPGTLIPIASPNSLVEDKIDEVIVFNYAYIDEIRTQLAGFTEAGGRIISVLDVFQGLV